MEDKDLEKSISQIERGRKLRADGKLDPSILCMLRVISTLKAIKGKSNSCSSQVNLLLAKACILHFLYSHDAKPQSNFILDERELYESMLNAVADLPHYCHADDKSNEMWDDVLHLLCLIFDILSAKGYLETRLCDVALQLYKYKDIPLEKMAILWKNRKLNHALCASPIHEVLIRSFRKHYGELFESVHLHKYMMEWEIRISGFNCMDDQIKQAALGMIFKAPKVDESKFLSSYLYYSLSESLVSTGKLIEALEHAKEALRLRKKLFDTKFLYSTMGQNEVFEENGRKMFQQYVIIEKLEISYPVTTDRWLGYGISWEFDCIITPWNVLSSYLESVFQVASIQENIGNAKAAQCSLQWGKSISQFQGLALFEIYFSSLLGRIYSKMFCWSQAKRELYKAKKILDDNRTIITCTKCAYSLEATINQELGDLFLCKSSRIVEMPIIKESSYAKHFYTLALEKLNSSEWRHSHSSLENVGALSLDDCAKETNKKFEHDLVRLCKQMVCWECLHHEVVESGSLRNFICMNWDLVRRKLSLKLLISLGNLYGLNGRKHSAHELLLRSTSILFGNCSSCSHQTSPANTLSTNLIGIKFPGDVLAVERADLLYYICRFSFDTYPETREGCCEISRIETSKVVSLLKSAFIICREVPIPFQKISRFLALLYILSTSVHSISLPPSKVSESKWAAYFHQASIGTQLNQQLFYNLMQNTNRQNGKYSESLLPNPLPTVSETQNSLRLAPETYENLEEFVSRFSQDLPCAPVICISLIVGADADIMRLYCSSIVKTWILVSNLNSDNQFIILLPLDKTLEGSRSCVSQRKGFVNSWTPPWGSTVIDDIAPMFREIMEIGLECFDIRESMHSRMSKLGTMDNRIHQLLINMEDFWFGAWKHVLLGQWPSSEYIFKKEDLSEDERYLQNILTKRCYVGIKPGVSAALLSSVFKRDAIDCLKRIPIILVLDSEVQLFPWENLPILKNEEVYRMLSVGSILATIHTCCQDQAQFLTNSVPFPSINPRNLYYEINPGNDCVGSCIVKFQKWLREENCRGVYKYLNKNNKRIEVLKSHDLYVYSGHGNGLNLDLEDKIRELNGCAATMLLGCESGVLKLNGLYAPEGAPILFLSAGSPNIVATLWSITGDVDKCGKALCAGWFEEIANDLTCDICDAIKYEPGSQCNHRRRTGSFMSQAREACKFPFFTGASLVLYGVPTSLKR